jgi:hypothetical protein
MNNVILNYGFICINEIVYSQESISASRSQPSQAHALQFHLTVLGEREIADIFRFCRVYHVIFYEMES